MRRLIVKLAKLLFKMAGYEVFYVNNLYLKEAQRIVARMDKDMPPGYGEAKRHKAFASMKDAFPKARSRDLAAAIEGALQ